MFIYEWNNILINQTEEKQKIKEKKVCFFV